MWAALGGPLYATSHGRWGSKVPDEVHLCVDLDESNLCIDFHVRSVMALKFDDF